MDILQKLVRANALLLQGAYQGAEHVLDGAIIEARSIQSECETLRVRMGEMATQQSPAVAVQSPRITEQDANEIINSAVNFMYETKSRHSIDYWLHEEGRALLNKLSEN